MLWRASICFGRDDLVVLYHLQLSQCFKGYAVTADFAGWGARGLSRVVHQFVLCTVMPLYHYGLEKIRD